MQEGTLHVFEFQWDEVNETHCAHHGVTPHLVEELKDDDPKFFPNKEGKTGTHMMLGFDNRRRLWTIIILPIGDTGVWRAITGWPSTSGEDKLYHNS